ncbi:type II toxin-antitoxin system death-on-curing family toxin [Klebsiella pneumoniae]
MILEEIFECFLALRKYDDGSCFDDSSTRNAFFKKVNYYKLEVEKLKTYLLEKKEVAGNFGDDPENRLSAIINNLSQSFDGKELYSSDLLKALNLLYFIIKDHPFIDGNKRSGAYLFTLFLSDNGLLFDDTGNRFISNLEITLICILIAKSLPSEREVLVSMIQHFINKRIPS